MGSSTSYADSIKASNPDLYNKMATYLAHGLSTPGQLSDAQAQILTTLNANAPKTIDASNWQNLKSQGYQAIDTGQFDDAGNESSIYQKSLGNINGANISAQYDDSGNLIGYVGDPSQSTAWIDQNNRLVGKWDASGNPTPGTSTSSGGGVFGGLFGGLGDLGQSIINSATSNPIGTIAGLAAAYYGGGAIADALGSGAAATPAATDVAAASQLPDIGALPTAGPGIQVASTDASAGLSDAANAANAASTPASLSDIANPAQGLQASTGTGTNLAASSGNVADLSGAQGLAGGTTLSGLADMGGAQGLTTASAGTTAGDLLNAAGTGGAATPATAGIGAGLGLGSAAASNDLTNALTTAGIGNGVTSASGNILGSITGSALGDMSLINGATGLAGALLSSNAAQNAANTQSAAAQQAIAQQQANFNTINAQQAPYRAAGYGALNQLASLGSGQTNTYDASGNVTGTVSNPSDYLTHQFNASDLTAGLAPNYNFMLQQGQMANQRAANASGGGLTGNALQGLQNYTQNYAGNAYQNAFNNYQTQRSNIYNTLAGIAGIGQTGQTATNQAATNATNAATQLGVGSAAAQAGATTGSANAYTNALSNLGSNYTLASLLNQRGNVTMPTA